MGYDFVSIQKRTLKIMAGCNKCKFYVSKLEDYLSGSYRLIRNCNLVRIPK